MRHRDRPGQAQAVLPSQIPALPAPLALAESIKQALIDAATFRRVRLFDKAIDTIREVLLYVKDQPGAPWTLRDKLGSIAT